MSTTEYAYDKERIFCSLEKSIETVRLVLAQTYDEDEIESIIIGTQSELDNLIPHLSYIGDEDNPLLADYFVGILFLALFKELSKKDVTPREVGKILHEYRTYLSSQNSKFTNFILSKILFSKLVQKKNKKIIAKLNEANYPDNFKAEFVEGDKKNFNWGWNFHACPAEKFFKKHGGEELLPYLCAADFAIYNQIPNLEFTRTQTLAHGAAYCDLRYKKGGSTVKGWPPEDLIEWKKTE